MVKIENDTLEIIINPRGAELSSIYNKMAELEYMWSGDPAIWGKKSPVLFPIVGTLKENIYYYKNTTYQLSRHGFARDMDFVVFEHTDARVVFRLVSDESTMQKFPFSFVFDIIYKLDGNTISVSYRVQNTNDDTMYFSVGGHPAFRLPFTDDTDYSDYYLEFSEQENVGRWPISKDGLLELFTLPILDNANQLALHRELFYKDAIVFKDLRSNRVILRSSKTAHSIEMNFAGFPYLGIWAHKNADFICIEPWCGIADSVNSNQDIMTKEGINSLVANAVFQQSWSITIS
jgi:galactose mutarotase-like enzyme